jgi:pilus assembly protein TadC
MREINPLVFLISLGVGIALFFATFVMQMRYPGVRANKRRRAMESNVLFVLRDLLIKMKSGISLFDAMSGIARAGHGEISTAFEITIQEMTAGISQIDALNRMALRTPSKNLRRVIWQLSNALRAGADISNTVAAIVQDMSEEQRVKIKNFGAELNPLAMVYMMVNIIMPTMGITFIIVLSSFMSMPVNETTFYMILLMLFMFQIMFVGMLKSKRQEISV